MGKMRVTYTKSSIGYAERQKETVRSLGLHRLHDSVIVEDSPSNRGMIAKVRHLVQVETLDGADVEAQR